MSDPGPRTDPATPPVEPVVRTRVRKKKRRGHWWRRKAPRRVVFGLAVLTLLIVADGAWAAMTLDRGLVTARDNLQKGADALVAGDVEGANTYFDVALRAAIDAQRFRDHPVAWLVGIAPWLGDDVDAIDALARSAGLAAEGGLGLVRAAEAVAWDGEGIPGATKSGTISPSTLRVAQPGLSDAVASLSSAEVLLDSVSTEGLLGRLRDAVLQARSKVSAQAQLVRSTGDLVRLLPGLTGGDGRRRYFLAIQNLDEPRGTGGFLGFYGVLVADEGAISLQSLTPAVTGVEVPPVPAPKEVRERYARFDTLKKLYQANFSPDFPTSARIIMALAEKMGMGRFDGVVGVDEKWLSYMLEATGPISTPAWPDAIGADNVIEIVAHDAFLLPGLDDDVIQAAIGTALFDGILNAHPSASAFATAISRSVDERHLQVYSTDPHEERLLERLGAAGRVDLAPNPLFVVWQDFNNSKVGYFAENAVDTQVTLDADGTAHVTTTVTLENHAPTKPPGSLLGSEADGPVGRNLTIANVYLPVGATDLQMDLSPEPQLSYKQKEFGHPVAIGLMHALSGEVADFRVSYSVPDAVTTVGGLTEYRIQVLPQPLLEPASVRIQIQLPPSAATVASSAGLSGDGNVLSYADLPATPLNVWVRFSGA